MAAGAVVPATLLGGGAAARKAGTAPSLPFALEQRQFSLSRRLRGVDRPLRTVVWLPAVAGRFPLVLFSHGLHGTPERFARLTGDIAVAGFVVAAPAYPYTMLDSPAFTSDDMPNQPGDASAVITALLGGPLAPRIDRGRIGAAGHSAGGYTTAGLLSARSRDRRISAAVIVAGGAMNGRFTGPPAEVLFVQGDADPVVPYAVGRSAYRDVPWPKAFLTLLGADHESLLFGRGPAAATTTRTILDFLRASLYFDATAQARLRPEAGIATLDRHRL
jgi:dienelactone hydrolase